MSRPKVVMATSWEIRRVLAFRLLTTEGARDDIVGSPQALEDVPGRR